MQRNHELRTGGLTINAKNPRVARGFTLVELLVVIAIIGVLVALLLPAVQAAREAARRTQCLNQMRQMMLAMHNHESSRGTFPSGGVDPWPSIEDYSANGKPFAAPKQGLSWAFQILPYLEQNAVHNIATQQQLGETPVALYFCPSRRPPTQHPTSNRWLMDYAAWTAAPTLGQDMLQWIDPRNAVNTVDAYETKMREGDQESTAGFCTQTFFWGAATSGHLSGNTPPFDSRQARNMVNPTPGVIVRSNYFVVDGTGQSGSPQIIRLNTPDPTAFRQIEDGTSNTMVLTEKRIPVNRLDSGGTDDDAGWSDGWDFDTLRLASCAPVPDSDVSLSNNKSIITAGSSHPGVVICGFADASMRGINYGIDLVTLNRLANKSDGEVVDADAL